MSPPTCQLLPREAGGQGGEMPSGSLLGLHPNCCTSRCRTAAATSVLCRDEAPSPSTYLQNPGHKCVHASQRRGLRLRKGVAAAPHRPAHPSKEKEAPQMLSTVISGAHESLRRWFSRSADAELQVGIGAQTH